MKQLLLLLLITLPFCMAAQSCSPADNPLTDETAHPILPSAPGDGSETGNGSDNNTNDDTPMKTKILINTGSTRYTATLEDTPAARAFATLLPMTVTMTELNGNEKFYNLDENLPTDTFRPGTIHAGDLLLWGSDTVVLFYETFSSAYSYTRLGKIDNPGGLAAALGRGNVKVTFAPQ